MLIQAKAFGRWFVRALSVATVILLGSELQFCQPFTESRDANTVIIAGKGIGDALLGMSEESIINLFPYNANRDQKWKDDCGDGYNWVGDRHENVLFRFKDGKLAQLEARSRPFHTAESITVDSKLSDLRKKYPSMRAYKLLAPIDEAQGNEPLIFWIDNLKGIAFALAYDTEKRERYLYYIVVFPAGKMFCPEGELIDSGKWVEVPIDRSLKS